MKRNPRLNYDQINVKTPDLFSNEKILEIKFSRKKNRTSVPLLRNEVEISKIYTSRNRASLVRLNQKGFE